MHNTEILVIGGGIVGSSVAYGLARQDARVTMLDEGDVAYRASRGNFGLVWVQGKGLGFSPYTRWTMRSARQWPTLASELTQRTGIDPCLTQPGGFRFFLTQAEMDERMAAMKQIQDSIDEKYEYRFLSPSEIRKQIPSIGPKVVGACYTPMDGHANPLRLLPALQHAARQLNVDYRYNSRVETIDRSGNRFIVTTQNGEKYTADKVVLCAGLGNKRLGQFVGLNVPVEPNQGQVMIGERCAPFLSYPTMHVRQTNEGTIQIGDSMEDVGFDDTTRLSLQRDIAQRAIDYFPALADMRIIRCWAALRIMSPDGMPIYQESRQMPGAYVVTCHSGVTLAANHVLSIPGWILRGELAQTIAPFSNERFSSQSEVAHAH